MLAGLARRIVGIFSLEELGTRLALRKVEEDESLGGLIEKYSLEDARRHFADVQLEDRYLQEVNRYFHARRIQIVTRRLGVEMHNLSFLDVGDTDGLTLKHLGKTGIGFNNSEKACEQIRRNGVEAERGDGERLPFNDKSFDVVLCFETLEHAFNPCLLLEELSRVARRKVYVTIPGVEETLVHSRIKGARPGEWHVIEFCERDFVALLSHTSLRVSHYERIKVFARPRGLCELMSCAMHGSRHLLGGSFKCFQFYELEPTLEDQGMDPETYRSPYFRGR